MTFVSYASSITVLAGAYEQNYIFHVLRHALPL